MVFVSSSHFTFKLGNLLSLNSHHVPETGVQGQSPLYTKAAIEAIGPRMFPTHEATGSSALAPGRFVELFQGLKFSPFQSPNKD